MKAAPAMIGLCLGLLAAVVTFGEIGHLRQLAPDLLPEWTRSIGPRSKLLQGRAEIAPEGAPVGTMEVSWRWHGFAGAAPQWDVRLSAPGLTATGAVRAPLPLSHVTVRDGTGSADLRVLSAAQLADPVRGELRIDDLTARLRLGDRRLVQLNGVGRFLGLHYDSVRVGNGPLDLSADAGGGWRLAFDVSGPAVAVQGRLAGLIGAGFVSINATVTEGEAMPQRWRDRLGLMAARSGEDAWRIRTRLP